MRCSHCGLCCEKTEMMLSNADVERLERVGYRRQKFVRYDRHGFARLISEDGKTVAVQCPTSGYQHKRDAVMLIHA